MCVYISEFFLLFLHYHLKEGIDASLLSFNQSLVHYWKKLQPMVSKKSYLSKLISGDSFSITSLLIPETDMVGGEN